MNDNLPEQIYRAYCNGANLLYGTDETPGFHNLPTIQREAWEAAAEKARQTMNARFVQSIALAKGMFQDSNAVVALDALKSRYER